MFTYIFSRECGVLLRGKSIIGGVTVYNVLIINIFPVCPYADPRLLELRKHTGFYDKHKSQYLRIIFPKGVLRPLVYLNIFTGEAKVLLP